MLKVGDRVRIIESVQPTLVGEVGTIVKAGVPDSNVCLHETSLRMWHTNRSGRPFSNRKLLRLEPIEGEAEWE